MVQSHANALSTEAAQNRIAQRHLSKSLVVSLMKSLEANNIETSLRSGGFFNNFDTRLL